MSPLVMVALFAVFALVMSGVSHVLKNKRAGSEKYQTILADFQQGVNEMLETDEVVEAVCGYKPCAAVTNKRLLVSGKTGIDSVPFASIKAVKGLNASGYKTTNPSSMLVFEIKADKKYVLGNHSEGFEEVAQLLMKRA